MKWFLALIIGLASMRVGGARAAALAPIPPVPTPQQRVWQEGELTMFLHFGVNTYTDREWGDGKEDPKIFNPVRLDARQWVRTARDAGFKLLILTAKHHDGFCLWPSRFTEHSVKHAAWKNGRGDLVREFTEACRAEGVKVGLYLSPWDRHEATYGTDAYNTYFTNQLTELLTQYGTIDEVWFDGACGEGPNGKKQVYNWPAFYQTIRRLSPKALIAINGPDVRWVGNESGVARLGESSVKSASSEFNPGVNGQVWYPAECDVSIRPGWFYHASQDGQVKTLEHLLDLYFKSVGRNSVLLLNVPPNRDGLFAEEDVKRLQEFGAATREIFGQKLGGFTHQPGQNSYRALAVEPDGLATLEVKLPKAQPFNLVSLREPFWLGERSEKYRVEALVGGAWGTLAQGTVIGSRNLVLLPETTAARVRIVVEQFRGAPALAEFALYHTARVQRKVSASLAAHRPATASSEHSQGTVYGADKAVDDDPETRWATADGTRECWLEVDLERVRRIGRVRFEELTPRVGGFSLEYRNDPSAPWQTALRARGAGRISEHSFAPVEARFVRLHVLDASDSPTIFEFEVFAP